MSSETLPENPKVFISYSWSSSERALYLATRLMSNGVDVIFDKWDLSVGQDKYAFMEQSVSNPEVSKVLLLCDRVYTDKANNREGGVGDETLIISPEIYESVIRDKFIPVIFEVDENAKAYCPNYIKSLIYIDLSTEDVYEIEYEKLLRNIHGKPLYPKPTLGSVPKWLENDSVDLSSIRDLVRQTRGYIGGNKTKADFLLQKCSDEFITALLAMGEKTGATPDEALLSQIELEKPLRDLYIEYLEAAIYKGLSIERIVPDFLEKAYNITHDASGRGSYSKSEFEFYNFALWEMLICTVAVLLNSEKYYELHCILTHSYFLRENYTDESVTNYTYVKFYTDFHTIERVCKPKCDNPNYYTLAGEILVGREKGPTITKTSLANADLVLYQMSSVLQLEVEWFPTVYYHVDFQPMWQRLKSKDYRNRIMPLFGVRTIEGFKNAVSRNTRNDRMSYPLTYPAPTILDSIKLEEIGSIK